MYKRERPSWNTEAGTTDTADATDSRMMPNGRSSYENTTSGRFSPRGVISSSMTPFRPMPPREYALGNEIRRSEVNTSFVPTLLPSRGSVRRNVASASGSCSESWGSRSKGSGSFGGSGGKRKAITGGGLSSGSITVSSQQGVDNLREVPSRHSTASTNLNRTHNVEDDKREKSMYHTVPMKRISEEEFSLSSALSAGFLHQAKPLYNKHQGKQILECDENDESGDDSQRFEKSNGSESMTHLLNYQSHKSPLPPPFFQHSTLPSTIKQKLGGFLPIMEDSTMMKDKLNNTSSVIEIESNRKEQSVNVSSHSRRLETNEQDDVVKISKNSVSMDLSSFDGGEVGKVRNQIQTDRNNTNENYLEIDESNNQIYKHTIDSNVPTLNRIEVGTRLDDITCSLTGISALTPLSVSTLSATERCPVEAATARFGRLLQECRELAETCGDSTNASSEFNTNIDQNSFHVDAKGIIESETHNESPQSIANDADAFKPSPLTYQRAALKTEIDAFESGRHISSEIMDPPINSYFRSSEMSDLSVGVDRMYNDPSENSCEEDAPALQSIIEEGEIIGHKSSIDRLKATSSQNDDVFENKVSTVDFGAKNFTAELSASESFAASKALAFEESLNTKVLNTMKQPLKTELDFCDTGCEAVGEQNEAILQSRLKPSNNDAHSRHSSLSCASDKDNTTRNAKSRVLSRAFAIPSEDEGSFLKEHKYTGVTKPLSIDHVKSSGNSFQSTNFGDEDSGGLIVGFGRRRQTRVSSISSSIIGSGSSSDRSSRSSNDENSEGELIADTSNISNSSSFSESEDGSSDFSDDSCSESIRNSQSIMSEEESESDVEPAIPVIARDGVNVYDQREDISELSFGGASALVTKQPSTKPLEISEGTEDNSAITKYSNTTPTKNIMESNKSFPEISQPIEGIMSRSSKVLETGPFHASMDKVKPCDNLLPKLEDDYSETVSTDFFAPCQSNLQKPEFIQKKNDLRHSASSSHPCMEVSSCPSNFIVEGAGRSSVLSVDISLSKSVQVTQRISSESESSKISAPKSPSSNIKICHSKESESHYEEVLVRAKTIGGIDNSAFASISSRSNLTSSVSKPASVKSLIEPKLSANVELDNEISGTTSIEYFNQPFSETKSMIKSNDEQTEHVEEKTCFIFARTDISEQNKENEVASNDRVSILSYASSKLSDAKARPRDGSNEKSSSSKVSSQSAYSSVKIDSTEFVHKSVCDVISDRQSSKLSGRNKSRDGDRDSGTAITASSCASRVKVPLLESDSLAAIISSEEQHNEVGNIDSFLSRTSDALDIGIESNQYMLYTAKTDHNKPWRTSHSEDFSSDGESSMYYKVERSVSDQMNYETTEKMKPLHNSTVSLELDSGILLHDTKNNDFIDNIEENAISLNRKMASFSPRDMSRLSNESSSISEWDFSRPNKSRSLASPSQNSHESSVMKGENQDHRVSSEISKTSRQSQGSKDDCNKSIMNTATVLANSVASPLAEVLLSRRSEDSHVSNELELVFNEDLSANDMSVSMNQYEKKRAEVREDSKVSCDKSFDNSDSTSAHGSTISKTRGSIEEGEISKISSGESSGNSGFTSVDESEISVTSSSTEKSEVSKRIIDASSESSNSTDDHGSDNSETSSSTTDSSDSESGIKSLLKLFRDPKSKKYTKQDDNGDEGDASTLERSPRKPKKVEAHSSSDSSCQSSDTSESEGGIHNLLKSFRKRKQESSIHEKSNEVKTNPFKDSHSSFSSTRSSTGNKGDISDGSDNHAKIIQTAPIFPDDSDSDIEPAFHEPDEEIGRSPSTKRRKTTNMCRNKEFLKSKRVLLCSLILVIIVIIASVASITNRRNKSLAEDTSHSSPSMQPTFSQGMSPVSAPTEGPTSLSAPVVWVQVGDDLLGESFNDEAGFSVSVSEKGNRVIIGARRNAKDDKRNRGAARIFDFNRITSMYEPITEIYGENEGDQCGFSVSISKDGKRVAVGSLGSDKYGTNSGQVRVFEENEKSKKWIVVQEFFGEVEGSLFGSAVSLSQDGFKLAVGAPYYDKNTYETRVGKTYMFEETQESAWVQMGEPINGKYSSDLLGWSVSFSPDAKFLAVGAPGLEGSSGSGYVKVYSYEENKWNEFGEAISNGIPGDRFGFSVSLSGNESLHRIAIGAPGTTSENGEGSGLACIHENDGSGWFPLGNNVLGEDFGENLGYSVGLTYNASRMVVGVPNKVIDGLPVGQLRVVDVEGEALISLSSINGRVGDKFGVSTVLTSDGSLVLGGATGANLVRVYRELK